MTLPHPKLERIKDLLNGYIAKKRFSAIDDQKVCLSYSIHSESISLFENRTDPHTSRNIKVFPIANIRHFESSGGWRVSFLNDDLLWDDYEEDPQAERESFESAMKLVHQRLKSRYQ